MKHLILLFPITILTAFAGDPKVDLDKKAIKSMCGCYRVDFNFAETFSPDTSYTKHEPYHSTANAEWIFIDEESEDRISLQHLLIVGPQHVIKHWRQDWIYENEEFYNYEGDYHWGLTRAEPSEVKGEWSQKVYQVDDCIRYEASAPWVHEDGRSFWVSETAAPLPRRENTKRNDYNVMERRNRQELTEFGWIHEQDNKKVIRKESGDQVLVMEKGYNTYTKIEDSECKAAKKWWKENEEYWTLVKAAWENALKGKTEVTLRDKVDDEKHFEKLIALQYQYDSRKKEEFHKEIQDTIDLYVIDTKTSNNRRIEN